MLLGNEKFDSKLLLGSWIALEIVFDMFNDFWKVSKDLKISILRGFLKDKN